jgi:hypothetical protein
MRRKKKEVYRWVNSIPNREILILTHDPLHKSVLSTFVNCFSSSQHSLFSETLLFFLKIPNEFHFSLLHSPLLKCVLTTHSTIQHKWKVRKKRISWHVFQENENITESNSSKKKLFKIYETARKE